MCLAYGIVVLTAMTHKSVRASHLFEDSDSANGSVK